MSGLLKFGSRSGKERSLLAVFILHSLSSSPKSGYDLLREIKEKTGGLWVPSKGTLYPVLHHLENEHLIAVVGTGRRAKITYGVTESGRETLRTVKDLGRESRRKMALYKNLIFDIFGRTRVDPESLLLDIKTSLDELPQGCEHEAVSALEKCLKNLKGIAKR